jgi:acylphosphatase
VTTSAEDGRSPEAPAGEQAGPSSAAPERTCVRVVVSGRVQGVFYRDTCRRLAADAGLSGWVRNTGSGGVEAWFEGEGPAVQRLVDWCRQGPPGARVTGLEVVPETPGDERGFRVR